ncbi:MAG: hypothetical protein QNJ85_02790 [Gammaproteobacteria bacterium]|nr:hypothetical protein [Gammaproteobacteria bacterium]
MNNYEDWAQLVAKKLKGEGELIAAIEKDELDDAAATDSFCRAVLEPFLPENFGIGSGRIVDAFGNYSDHLDLIVYNRDFPRIGLRATQSAFLYESVLAAFSIRAKFVRKTFFEAMDACASLARLEANVDKAVLVRLAKKNGLSLGPDKKFVHRDPLHTARFDLIGRPPAFVFGFSGMKQSYRQLQENIELWIRHHHDGGHEIEMKGLPAVIATMGCFAWRNAAPLALSNRDLMGIGNDDAPVRLIVLQLLYLLNRRLNVTADGYGLKPNLKAYLSQFTPPVFEVGAGNIADVVSLNQSGEAEEKPFQERTRSSFYEPARDHASADQPAPTEVIAEDSAPAAPAPAKASKQQRPAAAPKPAAAPTPAPQPAAAPVAEAKPAPAPTADEAVFDKPSPFASAPIPPAAPAAEPAPSAPAAVDSGAGVFDKPSPFASAPIPPAEPAAETPEPARAPMASPLGSAPIPMDSAAGADPAPPSPPLDSAPIPPAADARPASPPLGSAPIPPMETSTPPAIPPRPPVDIEFGDADAPAASATADSDGPEEDEFSQTVVIPPPNAAAQKKTEPPRNSTDEFISRVKQQLASTGTKPDLDAEQDSFTSTIPQ